VMPPGIPRPFRAMRNECGTDIIRGMASTTSSAVCCRD
jgi:hypothetical protein